MRTLICWGSKRGGTAGIGEVIATTLRARGHEAVALSVDEVPPLGRFDAVFVGGALYANRWPSNVRRFVNKHTRELRRVPVWFFSSGPLDDSADRKDLPPPTQIAVLAERVGAQAHVTFGGRLEATATGFPASAMAKTKHGDWRNPDHIAAWTNEISDALATAKPGTPIDHPAHSLLRMLTYGVIGWALLLVLQQLTTSTLHAIATPAVFTLLAWRYFRARGAREALPTAVLWTAMVALLDLLIVAVALNQSLELFQSIVATWLPYSLVFLCTWAVGGVLSTTPWPKPPTRPVLREAHR